MNKTCSNREIDFDWKGRGEKGKMKTKNYIWKVWKNGVGNPILIIIKYNYQIYRTLA